MVCLPEHFSYHDKRGFCGHDEISFQDNEKWFERYCQLAVDNQVWLSLGCYPERKKHSNG